MVTFELGVEGCVILTEKKGEKRHGYLKEGGVCRKWKEVCVAGIHGKGSCLLKEILGDSAVNVSWI